MEIFYRSDPSARNRRFVGGTASQSEPQPYLCDNNGSAELNRVAISLGISLMLAGVIVVAPAFGQVVQYQYTPPPPVAPLPFHPFEAPSTLQIPGVVPPDRIVTRSARHHKVVP